MGECQFNVILGTMFGAEESLLLNVSLWVIKSFCVHV